MLRITKAQYDAFRPAVREHADRQLMEYARKRFPRRLERVGDPELVKLVQEVRATANGYGIRKENDVATFLDLTVMYGREFHRESWAAEVLDLDAETMYGPDKMALLRHFVRESGVEL